MLSCLFKRRSVGPLMLPGILAAGLLGPGCLTASAQSKSVANLPPVRPVASSELAEKVGSLVDEIVQQEAELDVPLRRSKILRMKQPIFRAAIADPSIVEIVAFGTREIEIIGKTSGTTTVTFWLGDEDNPSHLSLVINVEKDDSIEDRRRLEYGELQGMINEMFPNSRIQLIPIADKLIVRGQVRDEQEAAKILSLLRDNSTPVSSSFGSFGSANAGTAAEPFPDASELPKAQVISLLNIPGEKQVMLKVRIAELKRSAVRQLGADFNFDVGDLMLSSALAGTGNIMATGTFNDDSFSLALNALTGNGSAKILAEPNLVVLSGQTADFISGGQFAVPTVVGVGGAQAATTEFKGFGTQLRFSPTVLDHDRIRLNVSPSFSTLNEANSVQGVFGVDTRSVNTTVELREGQVLAIAGLLQEQQSGESSRVPLLGETPLLRPIFENKTVSRDETELLILVSPELVHPMEAHEAPTILPGMEVTDPDDVDFFIYGDLEGRPGFHHRSTVWPLFRSRNCRCKDDFETINRSQQYYVHGDNGFSK